MPNNSAFSFSISIEMNKKRKKKSPSQKKREEKRRKEWMRQKEYAKKSTTAGSTAKPATNDEMEENNHAIEFPQSMLFSKLSQSLEQTLKSRLAAYCSEARSNIAAYSVEISSDIHKSFDRIDKHFDSMSCMHMSEDLVILLPIGFYSKFCKKNDS